MQGTTHSATTGSSTTFDVRAQVAERPWLMVGAALAAGYMLGNLGDSGESSTRYSQSSRPSGSLTTRDFAGRHGGASSQSWSDSQAAAQQWNASHPSSQQPNTGRSQPQQWNTSHTPSQAWGSNQPASQSWRAGQPAVQSQSSAMSELFAPIRDEINNITSAAVTLVKQQMREIAGEFMPADQRQVDRGMPDPAAGTDYRKTYHPPDETSGAP